MLTGLLAILGPQGIAIALLVSLLGSASVGAYGMHRWDNASHYRAEAKALNMKIKTIQLAQQKDAKAALEANQRADKLQEVIDEVTETIGDGSCFSQSESDSLRKLWN